MEFFEFFEKVSFLTIFVVKTGIPKTRMQRMQRMQAHAAHAAHADIK
jgi:hypothetical protein